MGNENVSVGFLKTTISNMDPPNITGDLVLKVASVPTLEKSLYI